MLSPKSLIALVVELFPFWEAPLFSLLFPFHHRQLRDVHTETSSIEPDFINILSLPHSTNKEPLAASGQRSKRISWREKGHLCLATLPLDCPLIENKKPFHFFFLGTSIDQVTLRHAYYTQNTFMLLYIYIIQCMHIEDGKKKRDMKWKVGPFFLQLLSTKYYFLDSNFRVSENKIK